MDIGLSFRAMPMPPPASTAEPTPKNTKTKVPIASAMYFFMTALPDVLFGGIMLAPRRGDYGRKHAFLPLSGGQFSSVSNAAASPVW